MGPASWKCGMRRHAHTRDVLFLVALVVLTSLLVDRVQCAAVRNPSGDFGGIDADGGQVPLSLNRHARVLSNGLLYDPLAALSREYVQVVEAPGDTPRFMLTDEDMVSRGSQTGGGKAHLTDEEVLERMGMWLPDAENPSNMPGDLAGIHGSKNLATVMRQGGTTNVITGSQAEIAVTYSPAVPEEVFPAFEDSAQTWADTFPSSVQLRMSVDWQDLGTSTLGAAMTPAFVLGSAPGADLLEDDTSYGLAMATAIQGFDFASPDGFHVAMVFNSQISWHLDVSTNTPLSMWDLPTTALHEVCHGLFFSGTVQVSSETQMAGIGTGAGVPGRFDQFLGASSGGGVTQSCDSSTDFFNAVTNEGLRFMDSEVNGTDFGLFSPVNFQPGSSIYHLDPDRLEADCANNGISLDNDECSDLMTQSLPNGYTQRNVGVPVERMLQAVRGTSDGAGAGSCAVAAGVPGGSGGGGVFGGGSFNLPRWAVFVIAGVGGLGVIVIVFAVVSMLMSKR